MSLLIFSSANKIAQGIIRRLYTSGAYEQITCADLYPNYYAHQKFLRGMEDFYRAQPDPSRFRDVKIHDKTDLSNAVRTHSHVLYITHDYFSVTSSKLSLLDQVATLSKKYKSQKFVALTPIELDHQGEDNADVAVEESENKAREANPDMIHLKSELTFGENSPTFDFLINRMIDGAPLNISNLNARGKPIHPDNISDVVEQTLAQDGHNGRSYALNGPEEVTTEKYLQHVANFSGNQLKFGGDLPRKLNCNEVADSQSENAFRFMNRYNGISATGFEDTSAFNLNLKSIHGDKGTFNRNFYGDHGTTANYIQNLIF